MLAKTFHFYFTWTLDNTGPEIFFNNNPRSVAAQEYAFLAMNTVNRPIVTWE